MVENKIYHNNIYKTIRLGAARPLLLRQALPREGGPARIRHGGMPRRAEGLEEKCKKIFTKLGNKGDCTAVIVSTEGETEVLQIDFRRSASHSRKTEIPEKHDKTAPKSPPFPPNENFAGGQWISKELQTGKILSQKCEKTLAFYILS